MRSYPAAQLLTKSLLPTASTVVVRLAAVSGFCDFARRIGLVTTNPAAEVKRPKLRQPTPSGLTNLESPPFPQAKGRRLRGLKLSPILLSSLASVYLTSNQEASSSPQFSKPAPVNGEEPRLT